MDRFTALLGLHGAGEGHVAAEVVARAGQHEVEAVVAAVPHQDVLHRAARRLVRLQEGDAVLRGAAAASCGGGGGGGGEDLVEEEERHGGSGQGEQPPGGRAGHHEPSLHSSPTTAAMLNASPCFTQLRCWQRCADLLPTFWLGEGQAGGCSDPDHGQCVVQGCVVCTLHSAHTNTGRQACVHTTAGTARTQRRRFLQNIYRFSDGGFEAEIKKNIYKS